MMTETTRELKGEVSTIKDDVKNSQENHLGVNKEESKKLSKSDSKIFKKLGNFSLESFKTGAGLEAVGSRG